MEVLAPIAIGLVIGVASGILGIGGGPLIIPALVILLGLGQHMAQGVSLAVIFLTAMAGGITHARLGNVEWGSALWIAPGAMLCGLLGAAVANMLDAALLRRLFALLLVAMGGWLLMSR